MHCEFCGHHDVYEAPTGALLCGGCGRKQSPTVYEVTFTDFSADKNEYPRGRRVVAGRQTGKNGIEAIKALLRARVTDRETLSEIDRAWTGGSNKRLALAGITFEANKVRV